MTRAANRWWAMITGLIGGVVATGVTLDGAWPLLNTSYAIALLVSCAALIGGTTGWAIYLTVKTDEPRSW